MMKKLCSILFLVCLFVSCFGGLVNAQSGSVLIDSAPFTGGAGNGQTINSDVAGNNVYSAVGNVFTGNGYFVSVVEFYMRRTTVGSVGDVFFVAEIYATSGGLLVNAVPVGVPLATSSPMLFNDFSVTPAYGFVSFVFDETFQVQNGVYYFVAVRCVSAGLGGAIGVQPWATAAFSYTSNIGSGFNFGQTGWVDAGIPFTFSVYGVATPTPTPTQTVPPTVSPLVVVPADTEVLNLRFSDEEYTTFVSTGYGLGEKSGGNVASFGASYSGSVDVAFGFRVWLIGANGYEVELTGGVPVAVNIFTSGNGGFLGFVSSSWDCPSAYLMFGANALRVVLYSATDDGANTVARAVFVSPVLISDQLVASTWTFSYHVDYALDSFTVSWSGKFGAAGIDGLVIFEPSVYDTMFFKLTNLDFAGFLLYPYLNIFGSTFYVMVVVALFGAYYLWTGKFSVVIFILIMLGSAPAGLLFTFLPEPANILVWLLMAVGLGIIMFRVFR